MLLTKRSLQELQESLSGSVCYNDFVIKWAECFLFIIYCVNMYNASFYIIIFVSFLKAVLIKLDY